MLNEVFQKLSVAQAAQLLGKSDWWLRKKIRDGDLAVQWVKVSGRPPTMRVPVWSLFVFDLAECQRSTARYAPSGYVKSKAHADDA